MARTAEYDPIVVDQDVGPTRLTELLGRKAESAKLDYKETYRSDDGIERLRMVKHVLAMANTAGGYIVMGVADNGDHLGLGEQDMANLDEAEIRQTVSGYCLTPIPLFFSNRIPFESKMYGLLAILPLRGRIAVAASDGQFRTKNGKQETLFRKGDVLVRHGSSSERWTQEDADWLLQRALRVSKDEWLQEFSGDFRKLMEMSGPSSLPAVDEQAFRKPPEEFAKLALDLLRRADG